MQMTLGKEEGWRDKFRVAAWESALLNIYKSASQKFIVTQIFSFCCSFLFGNSSLENGNKRFSFYYSTEKLQSINKAVETLDGGALLAALESLSVWQSSFYLTTMTTITNKTSALTLRQSFRRLFHDMSQGLFPLYLWPKVAARTFLYNLLLQPFSFQSRDSSIEFRLACGFHFLLLFTIFSAGGLAVLILQIPRCRYRYSSGKRRRWRERLSCYLDTVHRHRLVQVAARVCSSIVSLFFPLALVFFTRSY